MKKFMLGTVIFFGLIIVGLVVMVATFDLNHHKPKIEQAIRDASGYDLNISGDISTSFSPIGLRISGVSLSVANHEPFVSFQNLEIALELMPLLAQEIKVNYVVLSDLNLILERMKDGTTNFDIVTPKKPATSEPTAVKQAKEPVKFPLLNVDEVRLKNANIVYIDHISNSRADVKNLNIMINNISLDSTKERLKSIALRGDAKIEQIVYGKYNIYNATLDFNLKDAVMGLNSMKYTIFGSGVSAKARVDMSGKEPVVSLEKLIPNLKLENFSKEILERELLKGVANAKVNISFVGADELSAKKTAKGSIILDGKNVGIKGYDIDKIVQSYNTIKSGDLKQTGVSFLSSALEGASGGKGVLDDFKGGITAVEHLHVKIDIANKIATLSDVAMATMHNRVAVKGGINIVDNSLKGITVAILDKKGCATFSQGISGSLSTPKVKTITSKDSVSIEKVQEVFSMVTSLFGKTKQEQKVEKKSNEECKPFYAGVVKHPQI